MVTEKLGTVCRFWNTHPLTIVAVVCLRCLKWACHVLVVDTEDNEWVDPSIVLKPDCEQHDFRLEVIYDLFVTKRQKTNKNVHAHNIPQHTHRTRVL